jgi:formylglycine-generating enzyme required for sulfatase activity
MSMVPGGTFNRSDDPLAPATVSTFLLDTYEVTVGRFRAFVDAGLGTQARPPMSGTGAHPHLAGSGWDSAWNMSLTPGTAALTAALKCSSAFETWTDAAGVSDGKPMTCVTWYEAMAFCIWDGGYLPTEAEWNYAASGGSEQRAYPWSSPASSTTIDCSHANYRWSNDPIMFCVNATQGGVTRVGDKSPEGDGKWGHSDLGGNVSEWTMDYYAPDYMAACNDCANLTASSDRVRRGGSFNVVASNLRASFRTHALAMDRNGNLGMRCARNP